MPAAARTPGPGRRSPRRRARGLHRDGHAARQPAAADRDDDARKVVDVLEQLEPERPWPATTSGSSNGCTNAMPASSARRPPPRRSRRRTPPPARPRAERRDALDLGDRRLARHVHLARHAAHASGERERLRVVARAAGDDAAARVGAERRELAQRAADLERARPLQRLRLEQDRAATALAQRLATAGPACGARRRAPRRVRRRRPPPVTVRSTRRYGTATTASKPTSAPRGSDATPNAYRAGASSSAKNSA